MPFPVLGSNSAVAGYEIDNSLRFNDGDSPSLEKIFGTATNDDKLTFSFWAKRCTPSANHKILVRYLSADNRFYIGWANNDKLYIYQKVGGTESFNLQTNRLFRDPSAWYHIVIAFDTTQGTDTNRIKLYVNGTQETSFSTSNYPTQNLDLYYQTATSVDAYIGEYDSSQHYDGYFSDIYLVDGQQLAPTEFGETNDNGVWIPKRYEGTYGTNGFKLEFKNSGSLGTDTSGNGNNLTATNLTATDQTTDTPTNNFCTLNPLNITASVSLSEGNTQHTNTANDQGSAATMGFANGKWYWEVKCINKIEVGINLDSDILILSNDSTIGSNDSNIKLTGLITNSAGGSSDFRFNGGTETVNSSSVSDNDILMVAVDADNTKIYFGVNGTWMNSGDPAGGTGELKNFSSGYTTGNFITPAFTVGVGTTASNKFRQRTFHNIKR
jgi:hypothetical protein